MSGKGMTVVVTQRETYKVSVASLDSLLASLRGSFELIYVDGGAPAAIRDALRERVEGIGGVYLRVEHPVAPNAAKNMAIPRVSSEHVLFVDNDVFFEKGWTVPLVEAFDRSGAIAAGPLYLERLGGQQRVHMTGGVARIVGQGNRRRLVVRHEHRKGEGIPDLGEPFETEHLEMHALMIRGSVLRDLRVFDPSLWNVPENVDTCLTLREVGGALIMVPESRVEILLPEKIAEEDRAFYLERWSQVRLEEGIRHFRKKWNLSGRQPVLSSQARWVVAHRIAAYENSIHRWLGLPSDSILNRRLLAPIEHRLLGR